MEMLLVIVSFVARSAESFDNPVAAFNSQNYFLAWKLFGPLAESGNAEVEGYLGWVYERV